jgi:hypothetical protein
LVLVPSEAEISDDLKIDILGARRKLLFVEGSERSLDKPLYSLAFSNVSVIAKSSSRDVARAVAGIRDAADLHWLNAFGIVDNDRRTATEIEKLRENGIYALPPFSIESIHYNIEMQRRVVERHAAVTGQNVDAVLSLAKDAALIALMPHVQRLSERASGRELREQVSMRLPRREQIAAAQPIEIFIDVNAVVTAEREGLQKSLDSGDLAIIIARYPVPPALDQIADKLGFQSRAQYERAVRKLLIDDGEALGFVQSLFGTLAAAISAA